MPIIRIDMLAGRSKSQKKRLIEKVTEVVSEVAECPKEAITIVISDFKKENWGHSGKQKE